MKKSRRAPAGSPPLLALRIVVGLALALAVGEAGVRIFAPMDALIYQDSLDPALGAELKPGAKGIKVGADVEISAQGLRDDLVPDEKPAGEARVVVVGGHEAFGLGVERPQTFVAELPTGLDKGRRGPVRAVNLSMYSYSLAQKVELACKRAAEFHPDVVVLQASETDAVDPPKAALDAPELKNFLRAESALARWTMEWRYRNRTHAAGPASPDVEARAAEQLKRFKECVDSTGAKPLVALIPRASDPADAAPSGLRRGLETEAKSLGIPFVDAGPALRRVPAEERTLPGQPFLSPSAQDALATELRKRVAPLLPRPQKAPSRRPSA
jgi:hypothetical protein